MRIADAAHALVTSLTEPDAPPAVPEIEVRVARNPLTIWQDVEEAAIGPASARPYWAFAWPGGIAKARYILDNPSVVRDRRVLDIGSGTGIASIAAMKAGARLAHANDIDPLAAIAARLAASANGVAIETSANDLLGTTPLDFDLVLLADVVYDPELAVRVARFVQDCARHRIPLLFGDRGTTQLPAQPVAKLLEIETTPHPPLEVGYFERGIVWRLV